MSLATGSQVFQDGYEQPADRNTDTIGRYLFGGAWRVSNDQVAQIRAAADQVGGMGNLLADAEAAQAPAYNAAGMLGAAGAAAGKAIARVASSPLARRAAKAIVKVAGGWMVWNGVEYVFSALKPDGATKPRRMNVMNVRALARADRRVQRFAGRAVPVLKQLGYQVERHGKKKGHTHADHHRAPGHKPGCRCVVCRRKK